MMMMMEVVEKVPPRGLRSSSQWSPGGSRESRRRFELNLGNRYSTDQKR